MRGLLLITSGALVLGAFPFPIGYYTFLRILVCFAAVYVALNEHKGELGTTQILFGILAILFNPLMPVYLHEKGLWTAIDLVAAGVFLFKALSKPAIKTS